MQIAEVRIGKALSHFRPVMLARTAVGFVVQIFFVPNLFGPVFDFRGPIWATMSADKLNRRTILSMNLQFRSQKIAKNN